MSDGELPVRVTKALGLLPELEALAPLRAQLVSLARPDERARWSSSGPYLTLGQRSIGPEELRRHLPHVFQRITEHLHGLYNAFLEALEAEQRGAEAEAVAALVKAGRFEEGVGRLTQALAWYEVALGVSEALADRRPEVETLLALGRVGLALGHAKEAARRFQRALALAEAHFDQAGAIAACEGLGDAAHAQRQWAGAQAWYARGVRLAQASGDRRANGRLEHRLATLARREGDGTAAMEHVRRARECFEPVGAADEMARALLTQGQLEADLGRSAAATLLHQEALAWARRRPRDPLLEIAIRHELAERHAAASRWLEAEEELRRVEQVAIAGNLTRSLVETYTRLGTLRAAQQDATGFVFFEQALELCRALDPALASVAAVYRAYGLFHRHVGQPDEARAYLERARELFDSIGEVLEREHVEAELEQVGAA